MRTSAKTWAPDTKKAPPKAIQDALRKRLEEHARKKWGSQCREVVVRFRGAYAYVDAFPAKHDSDYPTHLCRLRYLGTPKLWEYSFFKYSTETYALSVCASGSFEATPEQAFDSAAGLYLAD